MHERPRSAERPEQQMRHFLDTFLESKGLSPYAHVASIGELKGEEYNDALLLITDVQRIGEYISAGDPVDVAGFQRMVVVAADSGTFSSFTKHIHAWRVYLNGVHAFRKHLPAYFTKEVNDEIKSQWGIVDSQIIYDRYLWARIPENEWPDLSKHPQATGEIMGRG